MKPNKLAKVFNQLASFFNLKLNPGVAKQPNLELKTWTKPV